MTAARKPRSPEYIERKRIREAERRRLAREALGFNSADEFRKFAAAQAMKTRQARVSVVQPSVVRRQTVRTAPAVEVPGQTVEQFIASGGTIEVIPTTWGTRPGPPPARHYARSGLL